MTRPDVDHLRERVDRLTRTIEHQARDLLVVWGKTDPAVEDMPAIHNFAAYMALRHHDLSGLQGALTEYGLSSLGRCEAHVLDSLAALRASLGLIAGHSRSVYPPEGYPDRALAEIAAATERLFGQQATDAHTRIMVTMPSEAAADTALVRAMLREGMTCARINCAHDDAAHWRAMAALIRAEAAAVHTECRILMDIAGPKCRIETVHALDKVRVFRGDTIAMVDGRAKAHATDAVIATITFPEILALLEPGNEVWIDDGKIGTRVVRAHKGRVELEVFAARVKGEKLKPEKGVNFPQTELHLDPLTEKDRQDLDVIAEVADLVGFSFVQRPEDVTRLRDELAARTLGREPMPILMKIETPAAVRNLPKLLVRCAATGPAGVMIARGDLAVEIGFARMSEIQEEIMWLCEAAHVPVVWATQVLEHMVSDGMPSRAEATDAAMAQRAECVMLNKGPFVVEGIRFLADVLTRMDRHQAKKTARLATLHSWPLADLGLDQPGPRGC